MHSVNMYWLLLLVSLPLVQADLWKPQVFTPFQIAQQACNAAIKEVAMVCSASSGHMSINYDCYCAEIPGFGSLADCLVQGYDNDTSLMEALCDECRTNANIDMDMHAFWSNYSTAMDVRAQHNKNSTKSQNKMAMHSSSDAMEMEILDYPVELNYTEFASYKKYYQDRRNNNNVSVYYGYGMLAYWAVVILVASVINWTRILFPGFTNGLRSSFTTLYKKHVGLPAIFGKKKCTSMDFSFYLLPARLETVIISGFYILTAILNGVGIITSPNNVVPNLHADLCLKVGVRTGITCGCVFPLVILFAGRNNILQTLTGWNYATFMTYHRWIALNVTLLVIIHSITFSAYWVAVNGYIEGMKPAYMVWGTVATIVGSLMLGQSILILRRVNYELFLFIHIVLAFFYLYGSYEHTRSFGFGVFYVASLALWALDRIVRIVRIATFGAPLASVSLAADETLKVVIPKPRYWQQTPGGYAYVHFLMPSCFWQSHPFSFTDCNEDNITMYIKVKNGLTRRVYQKVIQQMNAAKIRVLVEGPYGVPSHAGNYDNTVFIAGGNGIPGVFSECLNLARRTWQKGTRRIKLVWIIKYKEDAYWFQDELHKLDSLPVDVSVYITRPSTYTDEAFTSFEDKQPPSKQQVQSFEALTESLSFIHFELTKPNVIEFVKEEIINTTGSLAIVTCGHETMVDDVRHSVVTHIDRTPHRVDFFEELQVWA